MKNAFTLQESEIQLHSDRVAPYFSCNFQGFTGSYMRS